MSEKVPFLSARCFSCGDKVAMAPRCTPIVWNEQGHTQSCAVLYQCPNHGCSGFVVGYLNRHYSNMAGVSWEHLGHLPKFSRHVVPETVPKRVRQLLQEANDARSMPVASATMANRAIEAMLAEKGHDGASGGRSLLSRIQTAVSAGLLPKVMGDWANHVRLVGNQSHTDDQHDPDPLPTRVEAMEALQFANTLAEYLYVLPARIPEGHELPPPKASAAPPAQKPA